MPELMSPSVTFGTIGTGSYGKEQKTIKVKTKYYLQMAQVMYAVPAYSRLFTRMQPSRQPKMQSVLKHHCFHESLLSGRVFSIQGH